MRKPFPKETEKFRELRTGSPFESNPGDQFGAFRVKHTSGVILTVIVSDGSDWKEIGLPGEPWEHVSVSTTTRCPTWDEMCFVKDLFFDPEETVIQFHPPDSQYVNRHPNCLHMWRCPTINFPIPPSVCVG